MICKMTQSGVEICLIYDFILLVEIHLFTGQAKDEEMFNLISLFLFDNL